MTRATRLLAMTTALGLAASVYLFLDNRSLREQLTTRTEATEQPDVFAAPSPTSDDEAKAGARSAKIPAGSAAASAPQMPTLAEEPKETRMERRQRRTEELAAQFGRLDGETDEEYRARVMPMVTAGLTVARMRATENRRVAEEKAGVTAAQSKQLDQMFEKTYADVLDYTNKAIADGQLSPYERNVAGWLDFAGGLGGILGETESQIGKVLTPEQVGAMSASGFEWAEYLGANAPWDKVNPPPPRPTTN